MPTINIPSIDKDLIAYLKDRFKVVAHPTNTLDEYRRMEGEQRVIAHLEALLRDQNE